MPRRHAEQLAELAVSGGAIAPTTDGSLRLIFVAGQASELSPAVLRAARTMAIDRVTAEVVQAFAARSIPSILLKGPAVARWLYTDGTVRGYCDSDLLVPQEDFDNAERTLADLSFEQSGIEDFPGDRHAHTWLRSRDTAVVDLHRTLFGASSGDDPWDVLAPTAELWNVGGTDVMVLSEPSRALHVAMHAAQHGVGVGQPMEDLARAIAKVPAATWDAAAATAERLGATAEMGAGLRLLEPGARIAERLGLPTEVPLQTALHAESARPSVLALVSLFNRPGLRNKAVLVAHKSFPSPVFMRAWTPLARRGRLGLALAYSYRVMWLAAGTPRATATWWRARRSHARHRQVLSAERRPQ